MKLLLMYSLGVPSAGHLERLRNLAPDIEVTTAGTEDEAISAAADTEVILGHRYLRQSLPSATRLRWVQSSAGTVDRLPLSALADRDVTLSRSTIDSEEVALHGVAMAWAVTRALASARDNQHRRAWVKDLRFGPVPKTALVMGTGPVGLALARRLQSQGIEVICAKRSPPAPNQAYPCSRVLAGDQWRDLLGSVDWCFLALSHAPDTVKLFDREALLALRSDAVLINIGRGETLDNEALANVLAEGHLTGAALDVVSPSPLPEDHVLWRTPRLLLTPHVASHQPGRLARLERYFESQVARYLAGEPLHDLVDLGPYRSSPPA